MINDQISIGFKELEGAGAGDGLGTVVDVEFGVDVARVGFDGVQGEVKAGGDLGVAQALGDEVQDFEFAFA